MNKYNIRIIMRQVSGTPHQIYQDIKVDIEESVDVYIENIYQDISDELFVKIGTGLFRSDDIQQIIATLYS